MLRRPLLRSTFLRPTLLLSVLASAALLPALESDAHACGGCFHAEPPPGAPPQQPSLVTDHRMAIALSSSMTTLWDQVEYVGDPADFAWVLPVRGGVVVGIGSDTFLNSLDTQTAPEIKAPIRRCTRTGGDCGGGGGGAGCSSSADGASGDDYNLGYQEDSGVTITGRSVVGPYATVQIHGDDETNIVGWLRAHKYVVPTDIEPVLKRYVDEKFDFVAVRLRPGKGVQAMRPLRVSWRGSYPSLPLRMVAAGVGAKVGLKLFVIGDGRWRTKNFPTFAIDPASLTWDFQIQKSDYTTLRQKMADAFLGRAFAMEASLDLQASSIPYVAPEPPEPDAGPDDVGADVAPKTDAGGDALDSSPTTDSGVSDAIADGADASDAVASDALTSDALSDAIALDASDAEGETSDASTTATDTGTPSSDGAIDAAADTKPEPPPYDAGKPPSIAADATDREIAFGSYSQRRVTRLRADLPSRYLVADLDLEADENQAPLGRTLQLTKGINNTSTCPVSSSIAGEDLERPIRATIGLGVFALAAVLARRATRRGTRNRVSPRRDLGSK